VNSWINKNPEDALKQSRVVEVWDELGLRIVHFYLDCIAKIVNRSDKVSRN